MTSHKTTLLIVITLLSILFTQLFLSHYFVAMTWDEPQHISAGYSKLLTGDFRMNTEHPPLLHFIEALPLLILKPKLDLNDPSWTHKNMIEFTQKFFFVHNKNPEQLLFYSRITIMILTVLLGLIVFLWAKKLFGTPAGIIALALYTFEPNILANGILTTTDLGFTFFTFLALYQYWNYFQKPTTTNTILSGITLGLAQLSKYTAVFLWPTYAVILFLFTLNNKKQFYFHLKRFIILLSISILTINMAYLWHGVGTTIQETITQDPHLDVKNYPEKIYGNNPLTKFVAKKIPNILPYYYLKGLAFVINEGKQPSKNLVLGNLVENGARYYYVAAFAVKTTLPFLLLTILSITLFLITNLVSNKTFASTSGTSSAVPRQNQLGVGFARIANCKQKVCIFLQFAIKKNREKKFIFILTPILVITFALSMATKQIGIRYLLGIFPFLILFITGTITTNKLWKQNSVRYALYTLILLHATSSLLAFPNYLSYYNELIGSENGWKYFTDSNTDWGQDFHSLRNYAACKPNITIQYFGTNNLAFYHLEKNTITSCKPGTLAISANTLTHHTNFTWLANQQPIDLIGNSILLYNITHCPAPSRTTSQSV